MPTAAEAERQERVERERRRDREGADRAAMRDQVEALERLATPRRGRGGLLEGMVMATEWGPAVRVRWSDVDELGEESSPDRGRTRRRVRGSEGDHSEASGYGYGIDVGDGNNIDIRKTVYNEGRRSVVGNRSCRNPDRRNRMRVVGDDGSAYGDDFDDGWLDPQRRRRRD